MKALTLTQPWATLVAIGAKTIETRDWGTHYRGRIAIHAAKGWTADDRATCMTEAFAAVLGPWKSTLPDAAKLTIVSALPHAVVVAVADLVGCYRFTAETPTQLQRGCDEGLYPPYEPVFGNYARGRFGFWLSNIVALPEPVRARGQLGLWNVPAEIESLIDSQIAEVAS